jgi:2'-deoxynucleoside 5'-phosphate N-hydrolase
LATIYFSGAITGGRGDVAQYRRIVAALEAAGHRVLAGAVASETIGDEGEPLDERAIFDRDLRWLDEADVLVAEVSVASLGVGYEIAYARYRRGIPVICLWRPGFSKRCSAMISGDAGIELIRYEDGDSMVVKLLESVRALSRYPARLP